MSGLLCAVKAKQPKKPKNLAFCPALLVMKPAVIWRGTRGNAIHIVDNVEERIATMP